MGVASNSFHHLHIRKRIHKKHEKYPHPDKLKRLVDRLVYASVIILPIINIPQLLRIWINQDASGVAPISWIGFSIFAVIWAFYGYIHKEKPILYLNIALVIIQIFVVVGALRYG